MALQRRNWLIVDGHVKVLFRVLIKGTLGETYNIRGQSEKTNLEVIHCVFQCIGELVLG